MPVLPAQPGGSRHVSRLLCALGDGVVTSTADREEAAAIEEQWPGTGEQVKAARECHAAIAAWAVRSGGARSLVVCPAGYPSPGPDPHRAALEAAPGTAVVLADPDEEVALVAEAAWGADPRVTVVQSDPSDAAGLWRQVRGVPGPVCLLLPWVTSMLDPETAEAMIGAYGALLPAGSVVALSWWVPDGGPAGDEFMDAWRQRAGPAWGHAAADVTGWLKAAGMEILGDGPDRDVWDVRVRAEYRLRSPGRMVDAVARVR